MKIFQKYRGKIILRRIFAVSFGLAAVCILLSCILGFGWFRVSQIQQQESDYENRMDTYVPVSYTHLGIAHGMCMAEEV